MTTLVLRELSRSSALPAWLHPLHWRRMVAHPALGGLREARGNRDEGAGSAAGARTISIKELGGGIGKKIIPAVLSSHLDNARTVKQGLAAKDIRGV